MNLIELREAVKVSLGDPSGATVTDEYATRGIAQAVQDLSRLMPQEKRLEVKFSYDVADEAFDSGALDTAITLNNTDIFHGSEQVWSATGKTGTQYKRGVDNDYQMDYITGKITPLSTGNMSASTTYYITYEKDRLSVSLSSLTDLYRIVMVEYPMGKVPMQTVPFGLWGNRLYVLGRVGSDKSQAKLTEDDHVVIYYHAQQTMPTASSSGSYDRYLDEVIALGASGYALLFLSVSKQYSAAAAITLAEALMLQAANTTGSSGQLYDANSALDKVDAIVNTQAKAAFDAVAALLTSAASALAAAETTLTSEAETALDTVAGHITSATTALANADGILRTDAVATLTAVTNLINSATIALGKAEAYADSVASDVGGVAGVWTEENVHKGHAQTYLESGDDLINKVNLGSDAAALYQAYAEAETRVASLFDHKRQGILETAVRRTAAAMAYVQEAMNYVSAAQARNQKAGHQISEGEAVIQEGLGYLSAAQARNQEAANRIAEGQALNQEAGTYVAAAQARIREGEARVTAGQAFIAEAGRRNETASGFLATASGRLSAAEAHMKSSSEMRTEAARRIAEFIRLVSDRAHVMRTSSLVDVFQPR